MPSLLLTDWMTLGTAGPTVDGRNIDETKLLQAAKSYDAENYCAVINLEHYWGNLGDVQELRAVKDKQDRVCLQGRVRPNLTYLSYNASGSKLFFSMELTDNFAGTGETYLTGLAVTDIPASLGTTCARFSKTDTNKYISAPVEVDFSKLQSPCGEDSQSFMENLKSLYNKFFNKQTPPTQEEPQMTPEQFKALTDGQKAITDALSKFSTDFTAALEKFTAKPEGDGKGADDKTKTPANDGKGSNVTELSTALTEALKPLTTKMEEFSTKLADATKEQKGTDVPKGTGAADESDGII
ncbi:MAG: GPO family capsid scaffolding protein [Lentisphaerota bacterium]